MKQIRNKYNRWLGIVPVILVTFLLFNLYASYTNNLQERFDKINQSIKEGTTVVLEPNTVKDSLIRIIYENGYCDSINDAEFIANTLIERQKHDRLESLYSLQKRDIGQVTAHFADSLRVLDTILSISRSRIGLSNDSIFDYTSLSYLGSDSIVVVVERELEKTSRFQLRTPKERCSNVPVRLQLHHHNDTIKNPLTLGYDTTNENGVVVFRGLCPDSSYSVLPIRDGFEYRSSKGVVGGEWAIVEGGRLKRELHKVKNWINDTKDKEFRFIEKEHKIPLFTNAALRLIKNDGSILVRTPDEFKSELAKSRNCLLVSWWVLTLAILFLPKRRLDFKAGLIIACCMFLTGLSVLMMFSMVDPVNDELRGWDMTIGILFGVGVAFVLQFFDIVKRYNRRRSFFTIKLKKKEKELHIKKPIFTLFERWHLRGLGWLMMAIVLTCLLFTPLGSSVGGMKVNLNVVGIKFQPSEIAKYLIIMFTAIFFTENIDRIIHYSNEFDTNLLRKTKSMLVISVGLILLLGLYFFLGDMGPGLVLGITFVLLYSFSKSKQDLRDEELVKWKKWLKCDFMMLVYGVVSYVLVLLLFRGTLKYWYISGTLIWLIIWVLVGLFPIRKTPSGRFRPVFAKQVHETAIIMNLVIFIFVLGSNAGKGNNTGILGRLEERTSMCTNTWGGMDKVFYDIKKHGTLPQEVMNEPVSNTQVAHGLWALASGGINGQGLGNGKPSVIPAYHTDMILSSIGEQQGWTGLLFVFFAYFLLLGLVAWKGIKTGEELSIFLCMGVAIVTAVQLFVIALGSAGVIPLTGVTVPLLSYGKVSMILNIAAFGLVLSLITKKDAAITTEAEKIHESVRANNTETYSRPYLIPTLCFAIGCIYTLCVWAKYQIFERDRTLIQPAYVINREGNPVLEYNPRIGLVTNKMYAGRIFDRNGLMLATSNKNDISGAIMDSLVEQGIEKEELIALKRRHQSRYYPFNDELFFMVGDLNTRMFFSSPEDAPVGYMAEERHLSYLRGFDNVLYDKDHNPTQVKLVTDKKREDKYLQKEFDTTGLTTLRDYTALLPYLKDGSGKKLEEHNNTVEKGKLDLYLTVDAALQKDIQDVLAEYMPNRYKGKNSYYHLMRVSVVVLNAKNGDLLASANYPKPDCSFLMKLKDGQEGNYYSDNNKDANWMAYTDRDLGTTRQTAPGSTAKVMSAMAGLKKLGTDASKQKYFVSSENRVELGLFPEPSGHEVTMEEAIVQSSNCYFINYVNYNELYTNLETIYKSIGVSVGGIVPYYYNYSQDEPKGKRYHKKITKNEDIALRRYASFINDKNHNAIKMNYGEWKWAWGQGYGGYELEASPLNMARLASAIVNDGIMPYTQYVIVKQKRNKQEKELRQEGFVQLLNTKEAELLKGIMKKETENHKEHRAKVPTLPSYMGGKTGTAERSIYKIGRRKSDDINDGWYMFFLEGDKKHDPLAVVVRIERGVGSSEAVRLAGNKLLGLLKDHGYIQGPAN